MRCIRCNARKKHTLERIMMLALTRVGRHSHDVVFASYSIVHTSMSFYWNWHGMHFLHHYRNLCIDTAHTWTNQQHQQQQQRQSSDGFPVQLQQYSPLSSESIHYGFCLAHNSPFSALQKFNDDSFIHIYYTPTLHLN